MNLDDLPPFLRCGECPYKHFLSLNRALDNSWSIGYIEMREMTCIPGLAINWCENIDEAIERMTHALKRRSQRAKRNETK